MPYAGAAQVVERVCVVSPERRRTMNDDVGGQDQMRVGDRSIGRKVPGLREDDVHYRTRMTYTSVEISCCRLMHLQPRPTE